MLLRAQGNGEKARIRARGCHMLCIGAVVNSRKCFASKIVDHRVSMYTIIFFRIIDYSAIIVTPTTVNEAIVLDDKIITVSLVVALTRLPSNLNPQSRNRVKWWYV